MKEQQWVVSAKKADFKAIGERFGIDPVIARIIRNRDLTADEEIARFLSGTVADLHDPMLLRDMDTAVSILEEKIREGKRIRIVGDYDIDGVMGSYILKNGLERLGALADVRIPERETDGYGISIRMVEEAAADGVDTILTCDNGIAAGEQVSLAKEKGLSVIVTDHHGVTEIPPADAVVNPHRPDCGYPYKELCGAGVAYKLVDALFRSAREQDLPGAPGEDGILEYLSYAAFATVGDIVDLTGENRILVKEGLGRLRKTENRGLLALCRECGIEARAIDTYHIGFVLGPCINASGRLGSAMRAYELLSAEDSETASRLAYTLRSLNDSRKSLTEEGVAAASAIIESGADVGKKIFVLFLPELHESICGIVAGRIRELYGHPTYILTRSGDLVKGSGRSAGSYSMFDELCRCSDLLEKFGGHPMAAGLTLREENVDRLRRRLNEECSLSEDDFADKVRIDVPMPLSYISENLINSLSCLAPFGKGNPKPVFAVRDVVAISPRILGARRNVLKMQVQEPDGTVMDAVAFRGAEELSVRIAENPHLMIAYYPQINEYAGTRTLQIVIENWK